MRLGSRHARAVGIAVLYLLMQIAACAHPKPPMVACPRPVYGALPPSRAAESAKAHGFDWVDCDGSDYGIVAEGARPMSDDELRAWKDKTADELLKLAGTSMVGIGGPCEVEGVPFSKGAFLVVFLHQRSPAEEALSEVLRRTRAAMNLSDTHLRVRIYAEGPIHVARCAEGDPGCGPEPYGYSSQLCVSAASRSWTRHPMPQWPPLGGTCSHDGECASSGYICAHVPIDSSAADVLYMGLVNAYCGCLHGQCRWFEMTPYKYDEANHPPIY